MTRRRSIQSPKAVDTALELHSRARGFSLSEVMAVVVIVSILATLAIYGMRRYVNSSRATEATAVIQAIRAAQESYRAESHQYLDVTGSASFDTALYPAPPDAGQRPFYLNNGSSLDMQWRLLGPVVKRQVRFGYSCTAGLPGVDPPALSIANPPVWGAINEPWYVIQAVSDFDASGAPGLGRMIATSFSPELYSEPE